VVRTSAREAAAYNSAVERELSAGYALFELCQDEDVALMDAWDGNDDQLKVEPGRIGVESAAKNHNPLVELFSYTNEPGPVADGYELFGQVEVEWETDHVELWTSDSDIGRAPQLTLPPSSSGAYHLRAARAFAAEVQGSLEDYLWDDQTVDNHGLERWRFDFWPVS
jgi:hypothetical protein